MIRKFLLPSLLLLLLPSQAFAGEINSGDTAWMMVATAMVLIMTPGLAFFYAGMVRPKNVVSTLYQNFIALGVLGLLWVAIGYSLAFSTGTQWIGDLSFKMLNGVGQDANDGSTIPHLLFMLFQMMFAIITPILITGAFAERVRFSGWLLAMAAWSLVVYAPVCHWVWTSGGFLASKGALDFAGGFVVHMTAGYSALIAAIVIGRRSDFGKAHKPYDVGMVLLGTSLLWFGWFGFNAGSALASSGLAVQAFANTFVSAAAAMLVWTLVDKMKDGKPTLMGGCIGVVAGLVAITPAAGYVDVSVAILIGITAGSVCNLVARMVKTRFNIDDSLDVFACHGIGGTIGIVMTGLFATTVVNEGGANGLVMGGNALFNANMIGVVAVAGYSMVATFVILKVVNALIPLRISAAEETVGLDSTEHGETIHSHTS